MKWYSYSKEDFLDLLIKKYAMEEIENGCLWLWYETTDYLLMEWDVDNLPNLYQQDDIRFEYNQNNQTWSKKSCSVFSAIGAVSDLWNYEVPLSEAKEYDTNTYSRGRVENNWWYVKSAVDSIAKDRNKKHPDMKVAYYFIDVSNIDLVNKVLDKWYNICTGYYANGKYTIDFCKDGVLDWTDFTPTTYGHAINLIKKDGAIYVKDNYKWRKDNNWKDCNYYKLMHNPSEIRRWHNGGYVFTKVKEDNLERVKKLNEIKAKIVNWMGINSELWHLSDSQVHKDKLHDMNNFYRDWVAYIDSELKTLV